MTIEEKLDLLISKVDSINDSIKVIKQDIPIIKNTMKQGLKEYLIGTK